MILNASLGLYGLYKVCSESIWIGIVMVVHWVGCVCKQSWHVRTCLSNSWHKLHVAAFAQLTVVGCGSNMCFYVITIFTMCVSTEQRICNKFCFKIGKTATEMYQLLQQAYGEDAMGRTQVFDSFRQFKRVEPPLNATHAWDDCQHRETRKWLILRVSYTMRTLSTVKQLTRNSTWRSCDVVWISSPKTTGKMVGWRLDPAPWQCTRTHFTPCAAVFGQTRHCSIAAAAILPRSRTVWLLPIPKA